MFVFEQRQVRTAQRIYLIQGPRSHDGAGRSKERSKHRLTAAILVSKALSGVRGREGVVDGLEGRGAVRRLEAATRRRDQDAMPRERRDGYQTEGEEGEMAVDGPQGGGGRRSCWQLPGGKGKADCRLGDNFLE